jgi:hypothetical protein
VKRLATIALAGAVTLAACTEQSQDPVAPEAGLHAAPDGVATVSVSADAGPGSFRAAVEAANADPEVRAIRFRRGLRPIALVQPVRFTGAQPLSVDGAGAVLDGSGLAAGEPAFTANGGGDLTLSALTVRKAPGSGVIIALPADAAETVEIRLEGFAALDNAEHGVLINDQTEYFTDPNSTSEAGSPAGLRVRVSDSRFLNNGFAALDRDGLRINEGGEGNLDARVQRTIVTGNGGDGIELDERGTGNAEFQVTFSLLNRNGGFSAEDFDDGIDVDESGDGDVVGSFLQVSASENFEQGVDLNENGPGNMNITMLGVIASRNLEEGIEFEEDDDVAGGGDLIASLEFTVTNGNGAADGDAGLKLREKGPGNLGGRVADALSSANSVGGILIREDAAGDLGLELVRAIATKNAGDGIRFDENSSGNLSADVIRAITLENGGVGLGADQASPGTGVLRLKAVTASGNLGGEIVPDGGVIVEQLP